MLSLISLELSLVCSLATMAAVSIVSKLLLEVGGALEGPSVEDISKLLSEVGGASEGSSVEDITTGGGRCSWPSRLQLVF